MDNREKMANQLLMRGHASVDELLHASFGEWPPRGLDIVHENTQRVNLTSSLTSFHSDREKQPPLYKKLYEMISVGGYARLGGERKIFINKPLSIFEGKIGTLGHEMTHIMQGDHYWRARERMGKDGLQVVFPKQDAISNIVVNEVTTSAFQPGFVRRIANAISNMVGMGTDYLKQGIEVQARLQEAIIEGYPKWDRMPQNNTDFFFAMRSVGFQLTPELKKAMDMHPDKEELEKAFPKSKSSFALKSQFVGDIETVQANLTPEGQKQFWDYTMPRLYADLIEMYGDKHGRERMGMGPNETHAFRASHENDIQTLKAQSWTYAHTDTAGHYAYIRLDTMPKADEERVLKSLDNQYIGISFSENKNPGEARYLFVSGEHNMDLLKKAIGDQAPAQPDQNKIATAQASARKAAL